MTSTTIYDRVFFVGLSGAGKSEVACTVAARLGWQAVDCDKEITRRAGMPIARIFSEQGENTFRSLEAEVVQEFAATPKQVIALGGGAFDDSSTRTMLLQNGLVVWLQVSPVVAAKRLAPGLSNEPRPMLGNDPITRLHELLETRAKSYSQAHLAIDTDRRSLSEISDLVETAMRSNAHRQPT